MNDKVGNDLWAAECCLKGNGKVFNIDVLDNILNTNAKHIAEGWNSGYMILGVFKTLDEANEACDGMKAQMEKEKVVCQSHKD